MSEQLVVVKVSELRAPNRPAHGHRWGDWVLNLEPASNPSLDYVGKWYANDPYEVCLSQLRTWGGLNHWMQHLSEKDWGRESMGDFVNAVMDVSNLPYPGGAR
jgi:hypothetical protein